MPDEGGGLNESMQHWFKVHLAEFMRPNPLPGVDKRPRTDQNYLSAAQKISLF